MTFAQLSGAQRADIADKRNGRAALAAKYGVSVGSINAWRLRLRGKYACPRHTLTELAQTFGGVPVRVDYNKRAGVELWMLQV